MHTCELLYIYIDFGMYLRYLSPLPPSTLQHVHKIFSNASLYCVCFGFPQFSFQSAFLDEHTVCYGNTGSSSLRYRSTTRMAAQVKLRDYLLTIPTNLLVTTKHYQPFPHPSPHYTRRSLHPHVPCQDSLQTTICTSCGLISASPTYCITA